MAIYRSFCPYRGATRIYAGALFLPVVCDATVASRTAPLVFSISKRSPRSHNDSECPLAEPNRSFLTDRVYGRIRLKADMASGLRAPRYASAIRSPPAA